MLLFCLPADPIIPVKEYFVNIDNGDKSFPRTMENKYDTSLSQYSPSPRCQNNHPLLDDPLDLSLTRYLRLVSETVFLLLVRLVSEAFFCFLRDLSQKPFIFFSWDWSQNSVFNSSETSLSKPFFCHYRDWSQKPFLLPLPRLVSETFFSTPTETGLRNTFFSFYRDLSKLMLMLFFLFIIKSPDKS